MTLYEKRILQELTLWQREMSKQPSLTNLLAKGLQNKVNNLIPEKFHEGITTAIKNMVQAVLFGSKYITQQPTSRIISLEEREKLVFKRVDFYKRAAATSGAGTGAGGIFLGLADFPILISLKMKFLFDTASLYGFNVRDFKERLYILYLFELAFCSQKKRIEVYNYILNWEENAAQLPDNLADFDWRGFQQEYRDYIDLAKMLQLMPGIGAVVGAYANYKLMDKLAETAMNGYRLRLLGKFGSIG